MSFTDDPAFFLLVRLVLVIVGLPIICGLIGGMLYELVAGPFEILLCHKRVETALKKVTFIYRLGSEYNRSYGDDPTGVKALVVVVGFMVLIITFLPHVTALGWAGGVCSGWHPSPR